MVSPQSLTLKQTDKKRKKIVRQRLSRALLGLMRG
jgi:hypothetical protein